MTIEDNTVQLIWIIIIVQKFTKQFAEKSKSSVIVAKKTLSEHIIISMKASSSACTRRGFASCALVVISSTKRIVLYVEIISRN